MNSKIEQVIMGLIVLLIGVFIAISGGFRFDLGSVSLIAVGAGFILMYKTKRKSWALVVGCYLAYFGLSLSMMETLPRISVSYRILDFLSANLFFLTTGLMFMVLFYDKNKRGLLIPGVILLGFVLTRFVIQVLGLNFQWLPFVIYALCFYIIYRLGSYFLGRWPKFICLALLVAALSRFLWGR